MTKKKETKINLKMQMSKEELGLLDDRIPYYYIGNNGYEAREVISGFDLSYNIGTAVTYLLRAEKKHAKPNECIKKAIAHLEFELEKLENKRTKPDLLVGGKL